MFVIAGYPGGAKDVGPANHERVWHDLRTSSVQEGGKVTDMMIRYRMFKFCTFSLCSDPLYVEVLKLDGIEKIWRAENACHGEFKQPG